MSDTQQRELLSLSNQQLTDLIEALGLAPYRLSQLLHGLYRQRWSRLDQFTTLPAALRYLFQFSDGQSVETVSMPEGDGGEAGDGSDSGDEELVSSRAQAAGAPFKRSLSGGFPSTSHQPLATSHSIDLSSRAERSGVEGPLPRTSTRATICVSSQVGCAVECAFCMTALLGLHR